MLPGFPFAPGQAGGCAPPNKVLLIFKRNILLQFPLSSQAATAMACLGYLLVPTPPAGPANDLRWRVSRDPQEADQESTDLRDSERDVLWAGQRPLLAAPTANT